MLPPFLIGSGSITLDDGAGGSGLEQGEGQPDAHEGTPELPPFMLGRSEEA